MRVHFFDLATGVLQPHAFTAPADQIEANTPRGHGAIEGVRDARRQRVDVSAATPTLVDHEPDPPTLADLKPAMITAIQAQIDALERRELMPRAVREMLLFTQPPVPAAARLQAIDDRIAELRATRAAAAAAATVADLPQRPRALRPHKGPQ